MRFPLEKSIYEELWNLVFEHGDEVKHHSTILNVWWKKILCFSTSTDIMITSTCHTHFITIRYGLAHHIQIQYNFGDEAQIEGNLSNNTQFVKDLIKEIKDYFDPDTETKTTLGGYNLGGY